LNSFAGKKIPYKEPSMIVRKTRITSAVAATLVAVLLGPSMASAADTPKRKSGLWEVRMSAQGMPAGMGPMQTCVDEKSDDLMQQQARAESGKSCSQNEVKHDGDRVLVHSVCQFGKTTATTDAVFTGHFDSGYRGDIKTTYNPPLAGRKDAQMTVEAKWLGPCKPGQKPGDMVVNGMTINPSAAKRRHAER
jgi:hypothetical protein